MVATAALRAAVADPPAPADPRPNVLLILTDDQAFDTFPGDPAAMPWLQSQVFGGNPRWSWFPNAVASTPLCCPSRATILTGRYARNTGVVDNQSGAQLDETATLAFALHAAGYRTGLVGKYLNEFPYERGPYVPPGWDRFLAKTNPDESLTYYSYPLVDQGAGRSVGSSAWDYVTDVLGRAATDFVWQAPSDRPWFLTFTPIAPHEPWTPAPRHADAFPGYVPPAPDAAALNDVAGAPAWVRALPPIDAGRLAVLQDERVQAMRSLLAVDEAVHRLFDALEAHGELENTVVIFMTDNGFAFGEHRIEGKRCPYEVCIRTPIAIRTPWDGAGTVDTLISNVDLAPTIADLAGTDLSWSVDGASFAGYLRGGDPPERPGVLIEYVGDATMPHWVGVRAPDYVFLRTADGTRELYDLLADPDEVNNLAAEAPRSQAVTSLLAKARASLRDLIERSSEG